MEFQPKQAIYLQIADHICEKILTREWQADTKIPSIREIAVDVEVNPNTAARAFVYLENSAIIYKQRGVGFYVAADAVEKIIALKRQIFFTEDAPRFFKLAELLKINFNELLELHTQSKQTGESK
ncbi:MAG: GntR family transcriptional regulator [Gammaproteobacteria bacterium]|nr:GntR family transcriptional regulator [Gammaproteobacteria bacterium]